MQITYSVKGADLFAVQKYASKQQGVHGKYTIAIFIVACFAAPFLVSTLWPAHNLVRGTPLALLRAILPLFVTVSIMFVFLLHFLQR